MNYVFLAPAVPVVSSARHGGSAPERVQVMAAGELGPPRRIGARAGAGDGCHQACKTEHGLEAVTIEGEIRLQVVVIMQPGQDGRAKCIAGADGVDHVDLGGRDPYGAARAHGDGTIGSHRDHDEARAELQHPGGARLAVQLGKEPGQVAFAGFDDGAVRSERIDAASIRLVVPQQLGSNVGVEHQEPVLALPSSKIGERRRHRFQHQAQGADVQSVHLGGQCRGHHLRRQVRRRRSVHVELVLREAFTIELGHGQGGRFGPIADE